MEGNNRIPEIKDVEENLQKELLKNFKGERDGYVQVGPKKWFFPMKYRKLAQEYIDFEVRPDDVWITGLPRSGTTITEALVWLLVNNLDFKGAEKPLPDRVAFYESSIIVNEKNFKEYFGSHPDHPDFLFYTKWINTLKNLNNEKTRRTIKTHLPFELLPPDIIEKGCKVIYLCRNPKDVAVSFFTLQSQTWLEDFSGDFKTYWNFFRNGHCQFGPYFEHVKQAAQMREHKNFLFLFYDELKHDDAAYIKKIANFLERPVTEDELKQLRNYINFDNFKKASSKYAVSDKHAGTVNYARKGQIGDWRNHFTEDMCKDADEWIEKNTKDIGIKYPEY